MSSFSTILNMPLSAWPWIKILGISWGIYIIGLTIWVTLQKRAPISTLGWIICLAFIPYIGFAIYHFIGPQKLKRQHYRRLLAKTTLQEHSYLLNLQEEFILNGMTPSTTMSQLARLVHRASGFPVTTATSIELLVDGGNTYEAIFNAIKKATHHIHLEYYIFEPDTIGTALRDLLVQKAKEGVIVRLLVDGIGSSRLNKNFVAPLLEAGGEFAFFHNFHFSQIIYPLLNLRTHRKIIVCDGEIGFTGGLNITDEEDERTNPKAYHDIHLKLIGNAAHTLQLIFLEDWLYATRQVAFQNIDTYFPVLPSGDCPVQILSSGPDNEWEIIHRLYIETIHSAKNRIWLTTPYFVPTEATLFALTSAALRGVDVRILVPKVSDSKFVTAAARSYFDELIQAGIKIWEYTDRMLHSKTMVVDNNFCMLGTANFDSRSFRLNFEVCAAMYSLPMNKQLVKQFELDLLSSKAVLTKRKLHFAEKLFEASARLLSPLL